MTRLASAGTLPNLEAFCRTFENGSFTKAARMLEVTPQATSRSVARLEGALGVTLFRRTTRSLTPTDAGRRYYDLCVQALALLATGQRALASRGETPEGRVRISAPTSYGHLRLLPSLGTFRNRYPKVDVEVEISNRRIDFTRDGFDLAVRVGAIEDKTLVARKLGDFALGVYGSSAYLAKHKPPRTPADLAEHACIGFVLPSTGRVMPWQFAGQPRGFVPDARYRCSEDVLGVVGLARAGVGLAQVYDMAAAEDVARGTLVEVLAGFRSARRPFWLLYPKTVKPSRATRAMLDFIVAQAHATG
ncbi:LysR family transcriptional regulator [Pendulispora brunnea]|uniref:LysR family transcriptional regulator n=1 Tax=Pendulispora brunnea TaxID=2905690 RepID=A0ABZ2K1K9_9BACT